MGRIRAKYARAEVDRNVFEHLENAEASLKKAAAVYEGAIKDLPSSSLSQKRKFRDRINRIRSALSALGSVRPTQMRFDLGVEDTPESGRGNRRGDQ